MSDEIKRIVPRRSRKKVAEMTPEEHEAHPLHAFGTLQELN